MKTMANLGKLKEETAEAYYWMGFLMADGHFSKKCRLKLVLSSKDEYHLLEYGKFIEFKGRFNRREVRNSGKTYLNVGISVMDTKIVAILKDKFDITSNKTKRPPKFLPITEQDLVFAFVIGFIDGDGSIIKNFRRPDCRLTVKCHRSWLKYLNMIAEVLYSTANKKMVPARVVRGYAEFSITDSVVLKLVKRKVQSMNLPVLTRKWNRIDLSFCSRREISKNRIKRAKIMLRQGFRNTDIAKELGIGDPAVTLMIQRNFLDKFRKPKEVCHGSA